MLTSASWSCLGADIESGHYCILLGWMKSAAFRETPSLNICGLSNFRLKRIDKLIRKLCACACHPPLRARLTKGHRTDLPGPRLISNSRPLLFGRSDSNWRRLSIDRLAQRPYIRRQRNRANCPADSGAAGFIAYTGVHHEHI